MPKKFDRCVRKVKEDPKVDNPFAVCKSAMDKAKRDARRRVEKKN
jgi:hypothetical protein